MPCANQHCCLLRQSPYGFVMNEHRILEELLTLLEANGVGIRREPLGGGGGGLCTVKGEAKFFVDTQAPAAEVAALCAEAVPQLVDIETTYIRPQVRQFIQIHCNAKKGVRRWRRKE